MAESGLVDKAEPSVFKADHPFFFALVHVPTERLLFMGRVVDPTL
jgi:serpin B